MTADESHKIKINTPDPGYEPFPVSIMHRSTHEVSTFNPAAGELATIAYSLNKTGCVRIRLVHRSDPGLVIRTLQDWTEQAFGRYTVNWDGRDPSGNLIDNRKVFVLFEAKDQGRGRQHNGHAHEICRDPVVGLETRQASPGTYGIRTLLDSMPQALKGDATLEVRYYVDHRLIRREKIAGGSRVVEATLNTTDLGKGEHLVTVNVDDQQDHVGSAGARINVED